MHQSVCASARESDVSSERVYLCVMCLISSANVFEHVRLISSQRASACIFVYSRFVCVCVCVATSG